ncbi:MAG: hypothetical protein LUG93_16890 [Lachnospiraceae bacterium]|nr:hypothetical protein [Lachnospiraceae bacterium]
MKKNEGKRHIAVTTFLSALILVFYAAQLSVPVISDETVTMANAAWVTGRDWSLMIAHLGGLYYRFAQALMTVPLFVCLDDPDMIYRLSMVLQALVQATIIPIVYLICRRHLKMESSIMASLIGACTCFVPSIALYVLYYRGDYLLAVLPWYELLFLLETVRAAKDGAGLRRAGYTLAAVFCCVLAYMAHTRGIVLFFALIITWGIVICFMRKKSLSMILCLCAAIVFAMADNEVGGMLKQALYSVSGLNANAFESTDMGAYLNVFSVQTVKGLILLCLAWLNTLIVTTQGLVLTGILVLFVILFRTVNQTVQGKISTGHARQKPGAASREKLAMGKGDIAPKEELTMAAECASQQESLPSGTVVTTEEKITALFSFLVFTGYYAVGALYFKGVYYDLLYGNVTTRSDRLLYDRYSVCGAGMLVFLALYVLCCHREWILGKLKVCVMAAALVIFGIFLWKFLPLATKYTGYIYNSITLNTFQTVEDPSTILSGASYQKIALVGACVLGLMLLAGVLAVSSVRKKWMPYALLSLILVSDLALIQVNYTKIRKASNDYVKEATEEVVEFLQAFENDITEEYPYILKGGLSGIKIQFYQSQLMDYRMFGKKQEESLDLDNYFIISAYGDIDLEWYEEDYYLFEAFDYENAAYDIVYVKGEELADMLEELGYHMVRYISE